MKLIKCDAICIEYNCRYGNKWSKNFDERPHRMTELWLLLHAVIDDELISFAAYTAAHTPNTFNGPDTPQNC